MSVIVIPAEPNYIEAIAALTQEMDKFYGATEVEKLEVRMHQITEAIFSGPLSSRVMLACEKGQPVGFASYSFMWPAIGVTRSLYLKELYVAKNRRQTGIGKLLMQSIFDTAIKNNCSRVEWTADRDNSDAQRFYKALGVSINSSKQFYRLEGEELRRAANS